MNPDSSTPSTRAERLVEKAVRGLPHRSAPDGFAARVLAEIERREALPWWRKSFAHWPLAVRILFVPAAFADLAVVTMGLLGLFGKVSMLRPTVGMAARLEGLSVVREVVTVVGDKAGAIVGALPPTVLYGSLFLLVFCYGALATLGAAAYRTLTAARRSSISFA